MVTARHHPMKNDLLDENGSFFDDEEGEILARTSENLWGPPIKKFLKSSKFPPLNLNPTITTVLETLKRFLTR